MRPLWLLDVDGVLNAVEPKNKHVIAWGGYDHVRVGDEGRGTPVSFAPQLVEGIRELLEMDMVEIQWLTTWQERANALAKHFGWPVLAVANTREEFLAESKLGWWKLATAKRLAGDRALIWTDDDLGNDEARWWLTERPWRTLAVCPSYRGGIQPKEFELIQEFCISVCSADMETTE